MPLSEIAGWFSTYVYLPKLRDRVVSETAIRDALASLDPKFAYAEGFDEAAAGIQICHGRRRRRGRSRRRGCWCGPRRLSRSCGRRRYRRHNRWRARFRVPEAIPLRPHRPRPPRRFFGSVEIDMVRPVRACEAIINAVVAGLRRAKGARVKVTLEIEAEAKDGFNDADIGVVRDNARHSSSSRSRRGSSN